MTPKKIANQKWSDEDEYISSLGMMHNIKLESVSIQKVELTYNIEPVYDRKGIDDINFNLSRIRIDLLLELWNEAENDSDYDELTIVDENPSDRCEVTAVGKLPIEPEYLTIIMNDSWEPGNFKYKIQLGKD